MFNLKRSLVGIFIVVMLFIMTGCNNGLNSYINVEKGDKYKYSVYKSAVYETGTQGQKVKETMDTRIEFLVNIVDVDSEGNITMDYKYNHLKAIAGSDETDTKQVFDSKNQNRVDPVTKMFKNMIGNKFTVKITKQGEILEISDPEKTYYSVIHPINLDDYPEEELIKEELRQFLEQNEMDIEYLLKITSNLNPKGDIKIGDTWESEYKIDSISDNNINTTYTLDKVEGNFAHLSVDVNFRFYSWEKLNIKTGARKTYLDATMKGTEKVNQDNGFISEGEFVEEMEGKVVEEVFNKSKKETPVKLTTKFTYSTVKQ